MKSMKIYEPFCVERGAFGSGGGVRRKW